MFKFIIALSNTLLHTKESHKWWLVMTWRVNCNCEPHSKSKLELKRKVGFGDAVKFLSVFLFLALKSDFSISY